MHVCFPLFYVYSPCGHVVSGDLNIISNRGIRDMMKMGTKYRESVTQSLSFIRSSIVDSVFNYVNKMCTKFKLSVNSFNAWFNRVVEVLDNRIKFFSSRGLLSLGRFKPVLNKPSFRKDIQDLLDNCIIAPADKAVDNFVVVC